MGDPYAVDIGGDSDEDPIFDPDEENIEYFDELEAQPPAEIDVVIRDVKKSNPWLNKTIRAVVIGKRVRQLNAGKMPLIDWKTLGITDAIEIAEYELEHMKELNLNIPLQVVKKFSDGTIEVWDLHEFTGGFKDF